MLCGAVLSSRCAVLSPCCAVSQVESSVLGLRPAAPGCSPAASALATSLQPGSGLLTLPTSNATLQLYDVQHHRHVALLQVTGKLIEALARCLEPLICFFQVGHSGLLIVAFLPMRAAGV